MKKRSPPSPPTADSSASSPSSSSSSSSSSSCVVDYDDHHNNNNNNNTHNQQINEDEVKPPKPKRARRRTTSINHPKPPQKCPNNANANANAATTTTNRRSSIYRGVTRHRWTGRFEAHLWDKSSWNSIQNKKGRQVYLGAYDSEVDAARTYDLAALKYWGPETTLNFPIENYTKEVEEMQNVSKEEYLASLRRRSSGFSRGVSKYRGVARHHHNGRWEARIGRVFGNKYLYLGTFSSQEEAAAAYDLAAIEYRGTNAVTNFDISNYIGRVKNLMPKDDQSEPPSPPETKPMQQQLQPQQPQQQQLQPQEQEQKIKEQKQEEQLDEQEGQHQGLQEAEQKEQIEMPSKLEPKLISSIDHSSMLEMSHDDDERENPWSFCLDNGSYDPHLVPDIPLEEDESFLDLFDQSGFEDNIDLIFEGDGNLISMDETYSHGSKNLDKKMDNSLSFSLSSPLSPASTSSLVSCQL